MASNIRQRDRRHQWGVPPPSAADPRKRVESPRWRGDAYGKRERDDEDALFRGRRGYGLLHESSTSSRSSSGVDDDVEQEHRAFVDDARLFGGDDVGGGDPEEDDLMRMIMEKEKQEAESAAAIRDNGMHFQMRSGRNRMTTAVMMDDFFSPMRPPSVVDNAHRMHPFHNVRVNTVAEKNDRRHDGTTERATVSSHNRQHARRYGDGSEVTSNQVEHEHPSLSQEVRPPARHQQHTQDRRRTQKSEKERMVDANALWEEYINGNTTTSQSARHQPYSAPLPNGFHEEISLSRPNSMEEFLRPASSLFHDVMSSDGRRQRGRSVPEDHESGPAGKFSNESIPEVSYSPPMSPTMHSSSSRSRKSHSGAYQRSRGGGTSDDASRRRRSEQFGNPNGDENDREDEYHDDDSRDRNPQFVQQQHQQNAVFPFWSVAFLLSCLLVGISGFFVEDVMNAVGKVTKTSPATLTLSRDVQRQMHNRLEQLQTEIHEFRHTASEIEGYSQRVFDEVKAHLARMKHEREKQQEMIANEMNELRTHMLQMMNEMVGQERELIQRRVKATVDAKVQDIDRRIHDTFHETKTNVNDVSVDTHAKTAEQHGDNTSKNVNPVATNPVDEKNTVATDKVDEVEATKSAPLSTGESVMLLSWELLFLLTGISFLGGLVGLRVQNLNRRKRWFEQRKIRRQIQARLEQERAARLAEEEEDDDDDDEDSEDETIELDDDDDDNEDGDAVDNNSNVVEDWDDAATESSIETVSLMRRASEDLAESSNQRLSSGESDNGGDGNDDEDPHAAKQKKPTAENTERYAFVEDEADAATKQHRRYTFVLDVFSAQDEERGDDGADDAGATADGDGDGGAAPETDAAAADAAVAGGRDGGARGVEEQHHHGARAALLHHT
ncbi:hypothetical protein FI667_g5304, partial [Globisporangium splendens]